MNTPDPKNTLSDPFYRQLFGPMLSMQRRMYPGLKMAPDMARAADWFDDGKMLEQIENNTSPNLGGK